VTDSPVLSRVLYKSGPPGPQLHRWDRPMGIARRTGHYRFADGSVLRVDLELGRWVGTVYTPSMTIKTQIVGSDTEVHAWAACLAAQHSLGTGTR